MHDVVILTDNRYENPKSIDWYVQQVLTEDNLLKTELENGILDLDKDDGIIKSIKIIKKDIKWYVFQE